MAIGPLKTADSGNPRPSGNVTTAAPTPAEPPKTVTPDATFREASPPQVAPVALNGNTGAPSTELTNLPDAGEMFRQQARRASGSATEALSKSVAPDVLTHLTADEVTRLEGLVSPSLKDSLPALLKKVGTPEQMRSLLSVTAQSANPDLIQNLAKMDPQALGRILTDSLDGKPMVQALDETLAKVPQESRPVVAKMVAEFDGESAKSFLRLAQNLDGHLLGRLIPGIDKASGMLGGMKGVGRTFEAFDKIVVKAGLKITPQVAAKIVSAMAKVIPLAGASISGTAAVHMGRIAADSKLPPEIRFVASINSALNGVDAAVAVTEALGITDGFSVPAAIVLSATELGLELYVDHMVEQNKEGKFKPSQGLNAAIGAVALATAPAGEALLFGLFGPKAAQEKFLSLTKVGANSAVSVAEGADVLQAKAVGTALHATAQGINELADLIRNPEKYGAMASVVAQGATDRLLALSGEATAAGHQALTALRGVAADLAQKGEGGIAQLESIARHPSAAGKIAVDTLRDLATQDLDSAAQVAQQSGHQALVALESVAQWASHPSKAGNVALHELEGLATQGGQLARDATEKLLALGDRGAMTLENVTSALVEQGEQGLDTLDFIARHPGAAATTAAQNALKAVKSLATSGRSGAHAALDKLRQWSDEQTQVRQEAIAALGDIVHRGGAAAEHVMNAWQDNMTQGGREVFDAVANLRRAVEAN